MTDAKPQVRGPRLQHLDNLRTALVAWVIATHALLGYSAVGGWPYDEVNEVNFTPVGEDVLLVLLGPSGLVIIGLFFFISGMLTEQSLDRHGWLRYIGERGRRLGLPWLVSALLLWPLAVWVAYRGAGHSVSPWWIFRHRNPFLDSGALWFALVLLIFSVGFAITSAIVRRMPGRAIHMSPDRPQRPLTGLQVAVIVLVISFVSFIVRLRFPVHSGQVGDLHLWWWPQCLGMFVLGIVATRHGWTRHVPDGVRRGSGTVVVVTLVVLPLLAVASGLHGPGQDLHPFLGGWHWQAAATATLESTLVVTASVWLVGFSEHRLERTSPRMSGWTRAAFGAFVIQGPVLMLLATAGRLLDVPAEVKAPLVAAAAIVISFWLGGLISSMFRSRAVGSHHGRRAAAFGA